MRTYLKGDGGIEVTTLATQSKEAQDRAEANFRKKEVQAREASKAMAEYEAARRAERDKTARLKLLREAKQAADAAAAGVAAEAKAARTDAAAKAAGTAAEAKAAHAAEKAAGAALGKPATSIATKPAATPAKKRTRTRAVARAE